MKLDWTEKVPIIIITGATNAQERLEVHKKDYKASFVFEKPINSNELLKAVNSLIGHGSNKNDT